MPQTLLPDAQAMLITKAGHDQLVARLAELRARRPLASASGPADAPGSGELTDQIVLLETALSRAVVAHPTARGYALAAVGTVVEADDGARRCSYRLVLNGEEPGPTGDDTRPVSVLAPVGAALMGRSVGETVEIGLPGGRVRSLRLLRIRG